MEIVQKYNKALEEINNKISEQTLLREVVKIGSQEYVKALEYQIELETEKLDIIRDYAEKLEKK